MAANWYVHVGGATSGPHPSEYVRHWLANDQLPETALFWPEGASEWVGAAEARAALVISPQVVAPRSASSSSGSTSSATRAAATTETRSSEPRLTDARQGAHRTAGSGGTSGSGGTVTGSAASTNTLSSSTSSSSTSSTSSAGRTSSGSRSGSSAAPGAGASVSATGRAASRQGAAGAHPRSRRDLIADDAHTGQIQHAALDSRKTLQSMTSRLADFAGVERISGFRASELFSLATKSHTRDEVEEYFATGLPGLTPPLREVESDWPKPWMFVRLYVGASLLFLGFLGMFKIFDNSNLLPGMIMIGSFMVPVTVVVFFFEMNTPRNVSFYMVGRAFFAGGVLSLAITLVLVQIGVANTPILSQLSQAENSWSSAAITGVVEEIGKLLAIFLIALGMSGQRYPWILNGMLIGASVGAGFAAFESSGYALNVLLETKNVDAAVNVILLRGALAPFGHVVWAALAGGALWRVKRDRQLTPAMLVDSRVLRVLLLTITLHTLWNSPLMLPFKLKYIGLGILAWVLVLGMITAGLKQIKATQTAAAEGGSSLPQPTALQPVVPPVGRS